MTRLRASVREPTPVGGATLWSRQDWLFALLLLIFTTLAYLPALNGTPIWDDDAHITRPELRSWDGLIKIWTQPGISSGVTPQSAITWSMFCCTAAQRSSCSKSCAGLRSRERG
jgi:hypothetical protein